MHRHKNGRRNATGTVVYDQMTISVYNNQSLIKHKYGLRKRKANVASNVHSRQHLMGLPSCLQGPTLKMDFPHLRFST